MQLNQVGDDLDVPADAAEATQIRLGDDDLVAVSRYANGREVVGTTVLVDTPRWVQLWSLEGGELILLVGRGPHLLHWEPSLESLDSAENRALDWLTEPPAELR